MRPLDFLGRIKVKLGLVIVLAVGVAFVVNEVGLGSGLTSELRIAVAVVLALIMVQVLARGMTKPLREMASAAQTIAKGRYHLRVRSTSRDEVGELARAFNAMAGELGEVDRIRRELIANVSHELRTPITGLRAVLENVVDGVSAADPGTMRTALAQTERLGRLVTQLLDLSRLDSGARLIEAEPVELAALAEQAVLEAGLAREDVRLSADVPADLVVRADPDLLAQVLANLLDNAVRHSPPGAPVSVTAAAGGSGVRVTVADHGPGIPTEARARVFERFSRLDAGRTADAGGAGLGLAIVKEIVELHGGSVTVGDGPGCRMVVELPDRVVTRGTPERRATVPAERPFPVHEKGRFMDAVPAADRGPGRAEVPVTAPAGPLGPGQAEGAGQVPGPPGPPGALGSRPAGAPGALVPVRSPRRKTGLSRLLVGTVTGLTTGFLAGGAAAVFIGLYVSATVALATVVLATATGSAIGLSLAAGPRHVPPYTRESEGAQPPSYHPPSLFPRPELPEPPQWLLPAVAVAGLVAAVVLPGSGGGLGVLLVAVVVGAALWPALRRRLTPWTAAFGLTGYWLITAAVTRDADWLVALAVGAGAALVALAVSGAGAGWLGVLRGGLSPVFAVGPVPWFLSKPVRRLAAGGRLMPTLVGAAIAAVLLVLFGVLFASADAVFAGYADRVITPPDWLGSLPLRITLFAAFGALLAALALTALRPIVDPVGPDAAFAVHRAVWLVPLVSVNLLFAAFVAIQIRFLFGGGATVRDTSGLTYAQYAREGFFQLVVVSVFVLGIVAVCGGMLRTARRERLVLAGLLGTLCALTLVVLVSVLHRMDLYTAVYGQSRLRISVQATVWWLGAIFLLVLLAGAIRLAGRSAGWLPRTAVLVTGLAVGVFVTVDPELRVAESQLDTHYLSRLGADAVPALVRLPDDRRRCVLAAVADNTDLERPDPWNGWNLARAEARELLRANRVEPGACPAHR
ncbi:DUF4153 domain-containing protein [Nonomuraea longicatena]|uniref:Signal transduction histidine-protein kinase/phosphatase MprB n=1 Tax=Nonomuraea longicatena TaxID=83682 RepID=A0ABN1QXX9_9ACTN